VKRHPIAENALADRAGLRARYPAVFSPGLVDRIAAPTIVGLLLALLVFGFVFLGFDPVRFVVGVARLGEFVWFMVPPTTDSWARFFVYLDALGETVAIAFLGVSIAAVLAFPMALLAAKNVVANRILHFTSRRFLDTVRGVDELIWALIWVGVVGLGPFAGVLALVCSNFGAFGKLFSEAIEAADRRDGEGVVSTGGGGLANIRFGILPQVLPIIGGQILYFFESNTRSATIIGIVGAGGIGLHLAEQIRTLEYQHVSALILMILVAVVAIDFVSSRLRFALIGRKPIQA
jgi:phosphonate transport system permease protein